MSDEEITICIGNKNMKNKYFNYANGVSSMYISYSDTTKYLVNVVHFTIKNKLNSPIWLYKRTWIKRKVCYLQYITHCFEYLILVV